MYKGIAVLSVSVVLAACNPDDEAKTTPRAAGAPDTATTAEVDHTTHAANRDSTSVTPGEHAGHQMTSGSEMTSATDDHGSHKIASGRGTVAATADHSKHTAARTSARTTNAHSEHGAAAEHRVSSPSVQHAAHAAPANAVTPAHQGSSAEPTGKLRRLVTFLLNDATIQEAIRADTSLARLWQDSTVRSALRATATHH